MNTPSYFTPILTDRLHRLCPACPYISDTSNGSGQAGRLVSCFPSALIGCLTNPRLSALNSSADISAPFRERVPALGLVVLGEG